MKEQIIKEMVKEVRSERKPKIRPLLFSKGISISLIIFFILFKLDNTKFGMVILYLE
jgi:hypothetical protein